jgi:hypothetical protein
VIVVSNVEATARARIAQILNKSSKKGIEPDGIFDSASPRHVRAFLSESSSGANCPRFASGRDNAKLVLVATLEVTLMLMMHGELIHSGFEATSAKHKSVMLVAPAA